MHPYYDYDYCCRQLAGVGRDIRNVINRDLPLALTDVSVMCILGDLDIMECPFCKVSTEETYEKIRIQWNDRHPTANLHFNSAKRCVKEKIMDKNEALEWIVETKAISPFTRNFVIWLYKNGYEIKKKPGEEKE